MSISRRAVIAGGAAVAATSMIGARVSTAAADAASGVQSVLDGTLQLPVDLALPGKDAAAIGEVLGPQALSRAVITPDCNVTLWRDRDRTVLFDAGAGPMFLDTTGKLAENLADRGISPEDVTDIVLSHAHPDHIWGVVDDFDDLTFPNARYAVPAAEWDFWRSDAALERLPDMQKPFAVGARNRFDAIEEHVSLIRPGEEVLPGVEAVDTAGHTPGHTSYLIHADTPLLVLGDALTHPIVSFERPDWVWGTDLDAETAVATRRALLDRIATDHLAIVGFHLPHPGFGTAERRGGAYRYVAS